MPFDEGLLDDTAPRSARLVALSLLEDLARERERLVAERGSETLHDFRVALRKLRSWLRGMHPALQGSLPPADCGACAMAWDSNAGRDAEVFLVWLRAAETAAAESRARLGALAGGAVRASAARGRRRPGTEVVRATSRRRRTGYRASVDVSRGRACPRRRARTAFAVTLGELLVARGDELCRRLRRVTSVDDVVEAHQARIAGSGCGMCWSRSSSTPAWRRVADRLKALQDALGDLHDAHIWLMVLRDVVAELAMEEGAGWRGPSPPRDRRSRHGRRGPPRSGLVSAGATGPGARGRGVCPLPVGVGRPNGETILP